MDRTSRGRKVEIGTGNRRVSWSPKLKSKSKPKAESFASAKESLREELSHFVPNQNSEETGDKRANEDFTLGVTWGELEVELERRMNASLDDLNAELDMHMIASLNESTTPIENRWGELEAELHRRSSESMKELNAPRPTASGKVEAELVKRMNGPPPESAASGEVKAEMARRMNGPPPESTDSGEVEAELVRRVERPPPDSTASGEVEAELAKISKMTDVKSHAETPISEKSPQIEKKRKKLPNWGSHSEKNWMKKLKKTDSRSPMSTSSSSEITASISLDPKISKKSFWRLRKLNFTKSANSEQKEITSLQQQIGAKTGEMKSSGRKEKRTRPDHSKEESWLQRVVKARNQTWLEQAQIAMKEAKANQKSSEMLDHCGPLTGNSETESDRSGSAYSYPRTGNKGSGQTWLEQAKIAMKEAKANQKSSKLRDECGPLTAKPKPNQKSSVVSDESGPFTENSETLSDRSGYENICSGNGKRMAHDRTREVIDAGDGSVESLDAMFNWLSCTKNKTEPDMRKFDPRGMVIGGKATEQTILLQPRAFVRATSYCTSPA